MTMDFQNRSLINADLPGSYIDGSGNRVTRNLGTLGGAVQLGDGVTAITFPTQIAPHGMSFDGANDYLLRAEATNELTFTDPAPFSVELLAVRSAVQIGSYAFFFTKTGGGAGSSAPYALYLRNDAGVMKVALLSVSSAGLVRGIVEANLGNLWPASITTHIVGHFDGSTWRLFFDGLLQLTSVAAGCYAPDAAGSPLRFCTGGYGAVAPANFAGVRSYNFAVYPFALQPGEVAQLCRQRLAEINVSL